MGFFQSLFGKEKTQRHPKKEAKKTLPHTNAAPASNNYPITTNDKNILAESRRNSDQSIKSNHLLPGSVAASPPKSPPSAASPTASRTPTIVSTPPRSQRTSIDIARTIPRFQLSEDGTHLHHLTLPSHSKIAASLNDLVTGIAKQSLRWAGGMERKASVDEIMKERKALDARLHRNQPNATLAEKYGVCQETIGKGASGVVRVVHKMDSTGKHLYAVKELRKRPHESSKDYVNRLTAEYYISSTMHHPNIIETFDLLPLNETSPVFCQVMEYSGGGDLFDVLYDSPDGLEIPEANCFFKQLMRGVEYLHTIGVAHRDLKPENLLLTANGCLKISDFGSAACFKGALVDSDGEEEDEEDDQACQKVHMIKGIAGSEPYIAPEEFLDHDYDARLVDVWSCGIIYMALRKATHLWQVARPGEDDSYDKYLKFRQLLDEERENARKESCMRKDLEKNMTEDQKVAERAKREASMLKARETIRRKAKEIRFDMMDGIDIQAKKIIYRMLDPNPQKRITAAEILSSDWCQRIYCCQPSDV